MSNNEIAKTMINNLVTSEKFQTLFQKFNNVKCFNTLNLLNIFVADTLFENSDKFTPIYGDIFEFSFFDETGNKFLTYKIQGSNLDVFAFDTKINLCHYNNSNMFKDCVKFNIVKTLFDEIKQKNKNLKEEQNSENFWISKITSENKTHVFSFSTSIFSLTNSEIYIGVSIETTNRKHVDIPTAEDVKKIIKNWYENGQNIEAILELNESDPSLHSDYLKLKKNSYYLYNGLKPQLSIKEYEILKFNTMTKIVKWAKENYDNGTPVMSDIFYDKCVSNIFILTYIKEESFLPNVTYNETEVIQEIEQEDSRFRTELYLPTSKNNSSVQNQNESNILPYDFNAYWKNSTSGQIWDKCHSFYSIDTLEKYNPELNNEYIENKRKRFMYNRNFKISYNSVTSLSITREKSKIYDNIVKWSNVRWNQGKKTIVSAKYDRIKQRIYQKSKPKFDNVNINDSNIYYMY